MEDIRDAALRKFECATALDACLRIKVPINPKEDNTLYKITLRNLFRTTFGQRMQAHREIEFYHRWGASGCLIGSVASEFFVKDFDVEQDRLHTAIRTVISSKQVYTSLVGPIKPNGYVDWEKLISLQ